MDFTFCGHPVLRFRSTSINSNTKLKEAVHCTHLEHTRCQSTPHSASEMFEIGIAHDVFLVHRHTPSTELAYL